MFQHAMKFGFALLLPFLCLLCLGALSPTASAQGEGASQTVSGTITSYTVDAGTGHVSSFVVHPASGPDKVIKVTNGSSTMDTTIINAFTNSQTVDVEYHVLNGENICDSVTVHV